jgi:predicted esterase
MGYSMGGSGTWHIAAKFRQHFVAAIPIAGTPRQTELEKLRDLPLYVIHSQDDRIVPIDDDAAAVARLQSMGAPVEFAILPSGDHFDYRLVIVELRKACAWLETVWQRPGRLFPLTLCGLPSGMGFPGADGRAAQCLLPEAGWQPARLPGR